MQTLTDDARRELIEAAFFTLHRDNDPSDRPTLTVVLGQHGSATSEVAREIEDQRRPDGGAVVVSSYMMDAMAAGEGFNLDDVKAEELTLELVDRALQDRFNVVVTPAPTTEEMPLALLAAAKRAGYQVQVAAIAVNPKVAAAQTFQRSLLPSVDRKTNTDTFLAREAANVAKALRRIEANGAADRITIYDRHAQVVDRAPDQTASEAFEKIRGELSGAEKIRIAAAWEEVAEEYERNGEELPDNGQRMREQAHYLLRQTPGAAMNFEDRFPEHAQASQELASRYGKTLAKLFAADDKAAVSLYPELTNAFVAKHVADRAAQEAKLPEMADAAAERIHRALQSGAVIRPPAIRAEIEVQRELSEEAER